MARHLGRRWLQFGLGTAFAVTTIAAACFAYVANIRRHADRQQIAVRAIANLHGSFYFDCQRTADGQWLEQVPTVARWWLNSWLPEEYYRKIVWINLAATSTADDDLQFVAGAPHLEVLFLNHTQITDHGLKRLGELQNLRQLSLNGAEVSDAGLVALARLGRLEVLDLEHTAVSDIGLASLHGLHNLRSLLLRDTRVTGEGVRRARIALPECEILFEEQ
jgi:hypothetical protein